MGDNSFHDFVDLWCYLQNLKIGNLAIKLVF